MHFDLQPTVILHVAQVAGLSMHMPLGHNNDHFHVPFIEHNILRSPQNISFSTLQP